MPFNRYALVAALAVPAALWVSSARAAVITGLFNTGVDDNGALLADGLSDPHYQVFSTTVGGVYAGQPARAFDPPPGLPPEDDDAGWITLPASAIGIGPSTTTYRLTFSLAAMDAATAQLSGRWATGDFAVMFLNGVYTGDLAQNGTPSAFTLTQGFAAGVNTLDFQVTNYRAPVSGLLVDNLHGIAALRTAVPEPSAWSLMIAGFFGAGGMIRRRPRQALA